MTNKSTIFLLTDEAESTCRAGAYNIAFALRRHVSNTDIEVIDYLSEWELKVLFDCLDRFTNISWVGISSSFLNYQSTSKHAATTLSVDKEQNLFDYLKQRNIPVVIGGANAEILKNNHAFGFYFILGNAEIAAPAVHDHIVFQTPLKFTFSNTNKIVNADIDYPLEGMNNLCSEYTDSDFVSKYDSYLPNISGGCIFTNQNHSHHLTKSRLDHENYILQKIKYLRESSLTTFITTFLG